MKFKSGQEAVDALPSFIRIGPFDFGIVKWTAQQSMSESKYGACSASEQYIAIQRELAQSVKAADTFLHELLHALYWLYDMADGEKEEHVVGHVSTGMMQVYRDNPWLLTWLAQCCPDP